jgi:hypothetical protein
MVGTTDGVKDIDGTIVGPIVGLAEVVGDHVGRFEGTHVGVLIEGVSETGEEGFVEANEGDVVRGNVVGGELKVVFSASPSITRHARSICAIMINRSRRVIDTLNGFIRPRRTNY